MNHSRATRGAYIPPFNAMNNEICLLMSTFRTKSVFVFSTGKSTIMLLNKLFLQHIIFLLHTLFPDSKEIAPPVLFQKHDVHYQFYSIHTHNL